MQLGATGHSVGSYSIGRQGRLNDHRRRLANSVQCSVVQCSAVLVLPAALSPPTTWPWFLFAFNAIYHTYVYKPSKTPMIRATSTVYNTFIQVQVQFQLHRASIVTVSSRLRVGSSALSPSVGVSVSVSVQWHGQPDLSLSVV